MVAGSERGEEFNNNFHLSKFFRGSSLWNLEVGIFKIMEVKVARYRGAKCRLCRREGVKLFLKAERCWTDKCAFERRSYLPGQHGLTPPKYSDYGIELREKQKVKRIYGLLEEQFRLTFKKASRMKGATGENLISLLERRVDNIVFRAGFSINRSDARQLVRHGHILLNGKKIDIPSIILKPGDTIEVKEKSKNLKRIKDAIEFSEKKEKSKILEVSPNEMKATLISIPTSEDITTVPINVQLIVELYSK